MSQTGRKQAVRRQPGPKYLEIRERLLQQFHSGTFSVGEPLPKERELAVSLSVSVGTLRQALEGLEREGLIRRVRGKGTFVNSVEQRRAQTRTNIFWLIVPGVNEDPYPSLIEGAERGAARSGHRLLTSSSENDLARQAELIRETADAKVAGVVLAPSIRGTTAEHLRPLREEHIPVVFCNRRVQGVMAPLVTWPFVDAGRLAAEALLEHGHRRIVSLASMEYIFVESAGVGFRQTMRERGLDASGLRLICHGESQDGPGTRVAIRKALAGVLTGADRPTAVQCFNSFDAEQVYLLAGELGLRIPEDLSLLFFGAKHRRSALAQRITCVGVDECEIGVQACRLLGEMNMGLIPHESNQTIEVPLVFLPGETVGRATE